MEAIACVPCLSVSGGMLPAGYLRLWDASNDPWSDTTDSLALLDELTSYWNTNMRAQKRTVVYMARRVGMPGRVAGWAGRRLQLAAQLAAAMALKNMWRLQSLVPISTPAKMRASHLPHAVAKTWVAALHGCLEEATI